MTKLTFIILSAIYFLATIFFVSTLYMDGHVTLSLSIAALATLSWGFVKIKYEIDGYKEPRKKKGPESF
jgi:hypothetical protein